MSNYVKSTNFASKDTLPESDPAKIVKGTELDTEFNNIATAVGTKADLLSPTFTGTPTAPTASPGTNTTQLATTAFTAAAIQANQASVAITGGSITGITDLAIADGGTGASTASAAFNNLKQQATESATGVVELATTAEAAAGTDTSRAVTPAGLGAVVLGVGQTWQDVAASRALGTTYTNTTGRPIMVSASVVSTTTGGAIAATATVGGVVIAQRSANESTGSAFAPLGGQLSFIVPSGATYVVALSSGLGTIQRWAELR